MRLTLPGTGLLLMLAAGACPGGPMDNGPRDLRGVVTDMKGGGGDGPAPADLRTGGDLSANTSDLRPLPDLREVDLVPPPDLFIPDLAPATIEPKPACANATVTAAALYPTVQAKCAGGGGCHLGAGTAGMLSLGANSTQMRAALLDVNANFGPYKRVKASDVDNSLLIYKLVGQQGKIVGGNGQMPAVGMLSDAELCLFYNWVRSGAGN
jgi:hypothetical protein